MLGGYTKDYPYLRSYCKIEAQGSILRFPNILE
jgi:hypothetical protein